jgi:hypothetical protein
MKKQPTNNIEKGSNVGYWAFLAGTIIAIVLGLVPDKLGTSAPWLFSLLVVLGLVVGFINVESKDTKEFLLIAIALVVISWADMALVTKWENVYVIGDYLTGILQNTIYFVVPVAVVAGLKRVYEIAKGK